MGSPQSPVARREPAFSEARYDKLNHWIVGTQEDKKSKGSTQNCKQFHLEGRKEMKATFA